MLINVSKDDLLRLISTVKWHPNYEMLYANVYPKVLNIMHFEPVVLSQLSEGTLYKIYCLCATPYERNPKQYNYDILDNKNVFYNKSVSLTDAINITLHYFLQQHMLK